LLRAQASQERIARLMTGKAEEAAA
jgi:hypothetical protein